MRALRRNLTAAAAALALALAACDDRRAGTEVGNPEVTIKVTARAMMLNAPGEVEVSSLGFRVMSLGYGMAGYVSSDSGTCWKRPAGTLIDLADTHASPLMDTLIENRPWTWAHLVLRSPEGVASLPDSADFRTWRNPRYAKLILFGPSDSVRILFQMPAALEVRLAYSQETVKGWVWGNEIWVPFIFNASEWAAGLDPAGPWKTRLDGKRARYVLLSPAENAGAWAALNSRLAAAFTADTVQAR
jgi:hypothetical protein